MKTCIITSSQCTRRRLDATLLKDYFRQNGWQITRSAAEADLIILVTCAFTGRDEDIAVEMVERFARQKKRMIVTGCLPAINPQRLAEVFSGETIPTRCLESIDRHFPDFTVSFGDLLDANRASTTISFPAYRPHTILRRLVKYPLLAPRMFLKKRRIDREWGQQFYLRTSWGCRGRCSYCVIRGAIGDLRSKPLAACREELRRAAARGVSSITLDGDDLGAYGLDIGSSLPELLGALVAEEGDFTLDLNCLNAVWLARYSEELAGFAGGGRLRRIECCIQSGSPRILKLMNRYPDTGKVVSAFLGIKNRSPATILNTHVIVGFPTETEDDLNDTIGVLERVGFDEVIIFHYQEKEGAASRDIPGKVPEKVIRRRIGRLYRRLSRRGADVLIP